MKVFCHYVYEYNKGLRDLVLHTMKLEDRELVINKLVSCGIDFLIHEISSKKMNVYFGNSICVDVLRRINKPNLSELTDEEDFILGTMLGYGLLQQCDRYLERRASEEGFEKLAV